MDVVRALQSAKKELEQSWTLPARAEALLNLARAFEAGAEAFSTELAWDEGLPQSFIREKSVDFAVKRLRSQAEELQAEPGERMDLSPSGVVVLVPPSLLCLRFLICELAPALAAGNSVVVKIPSASPATARVLIAALQASGFSQGRVQVLTGAGKELVPLLASHPSARVLSFAGPPAVAGAVAQAALLAGKKFRVMSGAKNSLLILPEADFSQFDLWFQSLMLGQGRLPHGAHRVFVTEARAEEFFTRLEQAIANLQPLRDPFGTSPWTPLTGSNLQKEATHRWKKQALDEKAKVFEPQVAPPETHTLPVFTQDLTNCSVLQQEDVRAPVVVVGVVKYAHEMAKWTNTGDYGQSAQVHGPDEKARNLAAKLQVGTVWINTWLSDEMNRPGWKRSFQGHPDLRWDGSFFSDVRTLTPSLK